MNFATPKLLAAAPKHDTSEQTTPHSDDGLATCPGISLNSRTTASGDVPYIIDLPEITSDEETVDDAPGCEMNDDVFKESSEHDLL